MDNETVNHVLRCPHPAAQVLWTQEMEKVHKWIIDNKGCPIMADIIIASLNKWHHNEDIPPYQLPLTLQAACTSQNEIGWQSFIEGFWASLWRSHQKDYLESITSKRSSILWISKLQRQIWQIAWTMWEQRNNILHTEGASIHQFDEEQIDGEIMREWLHHQRLPQQYQHLFNGTIEQRLSSDIHQKRRWIISVWAAQDAHSQSRDNRNEHVSKIFERWKANKL